MNAEQLAVELEIPYWNDGTPHGQLVKAAAMLRKQDAAIRQLREALQSLTGMAEAFPDELHKGHPDVTAARAVLAATENL